MLGKVYVLKLHKCNATITTQGLWPTSPTDPQTDKDIQALSGWTANSVPVAAILLVGKKYLSREC